MESVHGWKSKKAFSLENAFFGSIYFVLLFKLVIEVV